MLGIVTRSLFKTNNDLHAQVRQERESCTERIDKLEERLDRERDECDERHQRLTRRLDEVDGRVRSISPKPFPKVTR